MTKEYFDRLPGPLKQLSNQIEAHCGFQFSVKWKRDLRVAAQLSHDPSHMTIYVLDRTPSPAVMAHELCHAERYFLLGVPFMQLSPQRTICAGHGIVLDAAENLDNMLEHYFIYDVMKNRFGFPKDPKNVKHDLSSYPDWDADEFSRRCTTLCNAFLVTVHFPELQEEMDSILKRENLSTEAADLTDKLRKLSPSKPKMVGALVDALHIDHAQVQLVARDVRKRTNQAESLDRWIGDGVDTLPTDEKSEKLDEP